MYKITIKDCTTEDIPVIQDIVEKTWPPVYAAIISKEQIRYMLDTIYSTESLRKVMNNGSQHFILLNHNNTAPGFAAYGATVNPDIYKLHKIYVLPESHGKGFGKILVDDIKTRLIAASIHTLDLNVNKYNKAVHFYERLGFKVIREEDIPIGPYWMNDFVMRLKF